MKKLTFVNVVAIAVFGLLMTVPAPAQTEKSKVDTPEVESSNSLIELLAAPIVGLWDVQITVKDCARGTPLVSFAGMHKYEMGGTLQVVPATDPGFYSAHMGVWERTGLRSYRMGFKMYRYDTPGVVTGHSTGKFDITLSRNGAYSGTGEAFFYDLDGNLLIRACPAVVGTRFEID